MEKKAEIRRKNALSRLESQLQSGSKKEKGKVANSIPLTDTDKSRMTREIGILKTKLKIS
jgi:hypothetical protein